MSGKSGSRIVELMKKHGDFTMRQIAVAVALGANATPQTIRGLSADIGIAKPSVVRAVDRLEQAKLAVRKPDREDRRSVLIQLTPLGKQFVQSLEGTQ